jgi:hypothetical protein
VEVVSHGVGGVVAGSAAKLGEALTGYYGDIALRKTCSSNARKLIVDRYDISDISARIEAIARHAVDSSDRNDLVERLQNDKLFELDIEQDEIYQSLSETFGGPDKAEVTLMRMVHNPITYRIYSRLLHGY